MYKDESLSYINFEEGRIRVLTPVMQNNGYDGLAIDGNIDLPDDNRGGYDYFIRDYQQNVRMILTQETHYGINQATMENSRAASEEPYFGQTGAGNEVATTRFAKPGGWNANTSSSVSKLSKLTGHTIGPNSLLKVMAGDVLNAKADYYYAGPVTNNNNSQIADIVTGLIQAITGSPAVNPIVHGNTANISSELTGSLPFASIADPDKNTGDQIPRAYLNIMFFNERFEFVEEGSMVLRVSQPGDGAAPLILPNIKAQKNGYAYIYLSNENDDAVYFDNFTVSYTRGKIIEENHYYAFGLRIAGISSRKFDGGNEGVLVNHYLYNDKELFEDADLNWYDYGFRNYDPQIARFTQLDPLTWDYPYYTPYQYAGNEPIANVDLDGLEPLGSTVASSVGDALVTQATFLPEVAIMGLKKAAPTFGTKVLNFFSVSTQLLKIGFNDAKAGLGNAAQGVAWFGKGLWNEGVMPTVDLINHDLNPAYGIFNGVNSQFTGQDFLSGEPMTRAQGVTDFALSAIPVLKFEGAVVKGSERLLMKESEKVVSKEFKKLLPSLDATGNVHGALPKIKDLANYSKEELQTLLKELKQSVKKRIEVTSKMGRDRAPQLSLEYSNKKRAAVLSL